MTAQFRRPRSKASFQVELTGPNGKQAAQIIDVNEYGARLTTTKGLKRGDTIHFSVLFAHLSARVQWASDRDAGVTFRPMINARVLGLIRQSVLKAAPNRFDSRTLHEMR